MIRFRKYDGSAYPECVELTFDDLAEYKKGPFGSALKKEIFVPKSETTVKVYEQQNAIEKNWTLERYFITADYFKRMKSFEVKAGDIIVSCAGTIGEIYILPDNAESGVINQALMRVRENKKVVNQIYFTYIFDRMLSNEGKKLSNGSALKNIPPFADLKKQTITIPCLEEQQKIADFLSSVDEVITESEKEVANLEAQKKGAMQKIFSQAVRFKADNGSDYPEWEEKKLKDITTEMKDGDWIESKDQSSNGIRLIQTGNIGVNMYFDKPKNAKYISEDTFKRLKCEEVYSGDILISRLPEPAGRACLLPSYLSDKMITAVDCTIVRTNAEICLASFLVQVLSSHNYFETIKGLLAGGTRQRISRKNLEEYQVFYPCIEEQKKIADFLSDFDTAIEEAKKELECWKQIKKGLLQQMFV